MNETDKTTTVQLEEVITANDMEQGSIFAGLGPAYFTSRRIVEKAMESLGDPELDGVTKKFINEIYTKLQEKVQDWLWTDTEANLQHRMWQTVDQIVTGLLNGDKWVLNHYVLGDRYDVEKTHKKIAEYVGDEVVQAHIKKLEGDIKKLNDRIKYLEMYR
jgi:hypothetical protein